MLPGWRTSALGVIQEESSRRRAAGTGRTEVRKPMVTRGEPTGPTLKQDNIPEGVHSAKEQPGGGKNHTDH